MLKNSTKTHKSKKLANPLNDNQETEYKGGNIDNSKRLIRAMVDPVTIDRLGAQAHERYARDQDIFKSEYVRQATSVSARVVQDTTGPMYPNELAALLGLDNRPKSWALFNKPLGNKKNLYRNKLIPSLGSDQQQHHQLETAEEKLQQAKDSGSAKERDLAKSATDLLNFLEEADRNFKDINGRTLEFTAG
ncbi:hypothetical protein COB21_02620 [Candidatus Aerophobetes bacterium]|uniref:Uncharacterized protein n=1 Tax=Aerophobetes bacterium TaxID=2030807 RepID=A0A2A4X5I8_UNCAE|nr:MAG: hypothetical protein COB21_02620 [Candidatus Aerophobetes bacterium]